MFPAPIFLICCVFFLLAATGGKGYAQGPPGVTGRDSMRLYRNQQDSIPKDSTSPKKQDPVFHRDSVFSRQMDDIVISGTLRPVLRLESPVAVEVYTQKFFRMNPVPSVFEAMQGVNGVRPQLNCNICATGDIHINGMEGPYTMVTIDGMPIVSSLSSVYGLFGIPSQLIERVEVVKGPASGLYGSEAVGGLINIITRNPETAPRFSMDLMATGWREYLADAGLRWKAGKGVTALTGVHLFHYDNPVDANSDGFTDLALQKRISLFQKMTFDGKHDRTASMAARYFYEDRWGGEMNWSKPFRGSDSIYGESIYTNRLELIGNYPLPITENMQFSWSYNYHHQDSRYGNTAYLASQHIGFGQFTWTKNIRRHDLLAGSALRYTAYDDNSPATQDPSGTGNMPSRVWLPGVFIQDEWKITKQHTLLSGLRADHHPDHGVILTPRLAFKWNLETAGVFRLNAGTGFRVVNLFTEEHAALTGARQVVVAESLDPERSVNVNLNHFLRVPFYQAFLTFDASLWFTRFSNQIIPDYDTDPNQIIYRNLNGFSISKGASLNTEFNWKNLVRVQAGMTVQDISQTRVLEDGKTETIRPVLTESWSGVWSVGFRLPKAGLWIDYTGNIYGPMRLPLLGELDPRKPESPVWSMQNIQLTKRLGGSFELYGGIKNLLNWTPVQGNPFLIARAEDPFDKNVEYDGNGQVLPTAANPYALTFDPTYVYAPNQGRRLFLGLRYTLSQKAATPAVAKK